MVGQCITYDNLVGSLRELSESNLIVPEARAYAKGALDFLNQNPKTVQLLKESLPNASCSDIAQLANAFVQGHRDLVVARGVDDLLGSLPFVYRRPETKEMVGQPLPIPGQYRGFGGVIKDIEYGSLALIAAAAIAAAVIGGRRIYKHRKSKTMQK